MKVQPTTRQLIEMLYERLPELFDRPAREWVGLTDEDVETTFWPWKQFTEYSIPLFEYRVIARAIEAKLREKNNG